MLIFSFDCYLLEMTNLKNMDFVELLENIRGKSDADLLYDVKLVVQDVSGVERGAIKGIISRDKDIMKMYITIKPILSVCALMVFKIFGENGKFPLTFSRNLYSKPPGYKVAILNLKKTRKATHDMYIFVDPVRRGQWTLENIDQMQARDL
jgi:hypothetical protein